MAGLPAAAQPGSSEQARRTGGDATAATSHAEDRDFPDADVFREIAEQVKRTPQEIEEHMQHCEGAAYHAAILAGKEALTKGLTATIGALPPKRRQYLSGAAKRAQGMGGGGKGRRKSKSGAQKRREGSGGWGKGPIPSGAKKRRAGSGGGGKGPIPSGAKKRRDGSGGGHKKKPRANSRSARLCPSAESTSAG